MGQGKTDSNPRLVGENIALFLNPHGQEPYLPSPAICEQPKSRGSVPQSFCCTPEFSQDGNLVRIPIEAGTSSYGTGEVPGPLLRNGLKTVCWTEDNFEYSQSNASLYQSHPWVLAIRADGSAFGVLADTTWRCEVDLTDGIMFSSEHAIEAVYVIEGASPQEVVQGLADLTGHMPMPPRWALGYQQCRWSYEPDSRVREIASEFRARSIPCDVIWMDIDYMDGFRCFTFDAEKFPDPAKLNADLQSQGFKTVWMQDPGIKVDPDYDVYQTGHDGDHFVKTASGDEFHGEVWPGQCAFPDFTRAATRDWWAGLYTGFLKTAADGAWNDMNEPSVFNVPTKTMPEDNLHRADDDLGGPGSHAKYHNIYGMQMIRATREAFEKERPDKRPFVLTRSNFIGGQRYAATWTGDNLADWTHLSWSVSMVLNMGLSGQPFVGPDIGGFSGDSSPQLFGRWMGIGALLPFARGHAEKTTQDKEPWAYGDACEATCRRAIERRYRLLPHLYTLFHEAHQTGLPVARPVFFADPTDAKLRDVDDCFMIGADILVRCQVRPHGICESPNPPGQWKSFEPLDPMHTGEPIDPELPEVLLREGAIIAMGPIVQYTNEKPLDPLTLVISLDKSGTARGTLYEDAGDGYGFTKGEYLVTTYKAQRSGDTVRIEIESSEGSYPRSARTLEAIVLLENNCFSASGTDGDTLTIPVDSL